MPRIARIVLPGVPHHVTQRGNNRQDVFFADADRDVYLAALHEECQRFGVGIVGYCLMTNHVHHLLTPPARRPGEALARAVGRTHWRYTQHVNRVHGRSGHLWQNRFYSCPAHGEHALLALRYIECNPLRARLCRVARRHRWSSAAAHCAGRDDSGMLDMSRWRGLIADLKLDWEAALAEPLSDREVQEVRRATRTGRPLAGDRLLARLERALGRPLRARPVGRPKADKRSAEK